MGRGLRAHSTLVSKGSELRSRNRDSAGWRFVRVDGLRFIPILQSVQCLAEKALRCFAVSCRQEIDTDRVSTPVKRPAQISPFAANLHVSLIDAPVRRSRATRLPAQPIFDLRRVAPQNPTVGRGMTNEHAALVQHQDRDSRCHNGSTDAQPKG